MNQKWAINQTLRTDKWGWWRHVNSQRAGRRRWSKRRRWGNVKCNVAGRWHEYTWRWWCYHLLWQTDALQTLTQRVCRSCLLSGRNVRWPRHVLPPGEYANGTDRQMDAWKWNGSQDTYTGYLLRSSLWITTLFHNGTYMPTKWLYTRQVNNGLNTRQVTKRWHETGNEMATRKTTKCLYR